MISPETRRLLEDLGKSPYSRAIQDFLDDELANIDTVRGVKSLEESLGREIALNLVERLFSFMKRPNPQRSKNKTSYT
jgi:hypothetical protein